MKRLAIITTHPVQYYAPIFKLLHQGGEICIMVFYTWGKDAETKFDPGFGKKVSWDIPLLEGYPYTWVNNTSKAPGSHHFKGIINPDLENQVTNWKADAILVYGWAYQSHLKIMRHFSGKIPVYFRGDSTLLNEPKGIKKLLKYVFLKWVYKHVDHAFYVGTNNKNYYKQYGLSDKQLSFAPHAVDNGRFMKDHKKEAAELRLSLNLKEKDILVLFAGKFETIKNVELLLAAFIVFADPRLHLLLVGNGLKEVVLKKVASESKIAANIHFLDFKNQSYMPTLYQAADLFCLPSLSETWGLAVNEAMACEKAILVSNTVGCAVDLVKIKYNGAIFKCGDQADLIRCLRELTSSKSKMIEYGKNSAKIIKDWNFSKIVGAIEAEINKPHK